MKIDFDLVSIRRAGAYTSPKKIARSWAAVLAVSSVLIGAEVAAQSVEEVGRSRFVESCAVCHGEDGRGTGPVATMLTQKPMDLTLLAKNNGGAFPFMQVYDTIDGREMPGAHGTREMPIWGAQWRGGPSPSGETALRGRILEMIVYLRSIQQ